MLNDAANTAASELIIRENYRYNVDVTGGVVEEGDYMIFAPKAFVDLDEANVCEQAWLAHLAFSRRQLRATTKPRRRRLFQTTTKKMQSPSPPPASTTIEGMKEFVALMRAP